MCGILGVAKIQNQTHPELFLTALNKMQHRGPDGFGVFHTEYVSLGHRRLSIIDLSTQANQPFLNADGKVAIIFNGEIYNYKELSNGFTLTTQSDTEVLLQGYLNHGISFFSRIRGIYAFCIYDNRDNNDPKCILMRDPAGVKPLYYTHKENALFFASEVKSLLPLLPFKPTANDRILKQYIHLGYCPEPETAYTEINCLIPGTCMVYSIRSNTISLTTIFQYSFHEKKAISLNQAITHTKHLLQQACSRNLVADVHINIALSGGIDSSLIYGYSNQLSQQGITGITIASSDADYDETAAAKAHADFIHAPHQIEYTDAEQKMELLNKLLDHFDQPYADSSFIPFYFLCKAASKHSKVLIGGDSGDEIHNGYAGHQYLPVLQKAKAFNTLFIPLLKVLSLISSKHRKRVIRKIIALLNTNSLPEMVFLWESWFPHPINMYPINPFKFEDTYHDDKTTVDDAHQYINETYFKGRMQSDYLRKSDMMSMINSIEFRVPMLDEDLTAFSLAIPYSYKSSIRQTKKILRLLHSELYPSYLSRLPKKGFTIPLDHWLGKENLDLIQDYLIHKSKRYTQYLSEDYILLLFDQLKNNDNSISRASIYQRILIVYSLERWLIKINPNPSIE